MQLSDINELTQTASLDDANALLTKGWRLVAVVPAPPLPALELDSLVIYVLGRKRFGLLGEGWGESVKVE